jgi:hypothetical protein
VLCRAVRAGDSGTRVSSRAVRPVGQRSACRSSARPRRGSVPVRGRNRWWGRVRCSTSRSGHRVTDSAGRRRRPSCALSKRFTSKRKVTEEFRMNQGLLPRDTFLCRAIDSLRGSVQRRSASTSRLQSQLHLDLRDGVNRGIGVLSTAECLAFCGPGSPGAERRRPAGTAHVRRAVRVAALVRSGRRRVW